MPKNNSLNLLAWSDNSFSNCAPSAGYIVQCARLRALKTADVFLF